jgi:hypothetical protein
MYLQISYIILLSPSILLSSIALILDSGKDYLQDKANKNLKDEALIWEGRALEFKVYDFSQVRDAASNFSERNKLGEGGFGPVYKVTTFCSWR